MSIKTLSNLASRPCTARGPAWAAVLTWKWGFDGLNPRCQAAIWICLAPAGAASAMCEQQGDAGQQDDPSRKGKKRVQANSGVLITALEAAGPWQVNHDTARAIPAWQIIDSSANGAENVKCQAGAGKGSLCPCQPGVTAGLRNFSCVGEELGHFSGVVAALGVAMRTGGF